LSGSAPSGLTGDPRWPRGTLMSRLDPETVDELLQLVAGQKYPSGTVLIREGAPGTHVYLLRPSGRAPSACVKVTATSESGVETMLGIRAAGDIVGELAVLGLQVRTATVTTCSTLTAHAIPADTFTAFMARRPQVWNAVTLMIAERLEWANKRRVDQAGHDAPVQTARVIADILALYGYRNGDGHEELGVPLSQAELGSLIGLSKESIAKAVGQLRKVGLIETRYRRILVLDSARLRAFAGSTKQ
jgi:CRP/FNR family transcriptional regulator, cyclic AMP receptor protein